MIYLDSASSHPILPAVKERLMQHWQEYQGQGENVSAPHQIAQKIKQQLSSLTDRFCQDLGIAPKEWLWLSGATESNNLAIHLAESFYKKSLKVFIHPFAHASLKEPALFKGMDTVILPLKSDGLVDVEASFELIKDALPAALVLWPYGDNEWGFIDAPIDFWFELQQKGAWLHLDAAQSFAKIDLNIQQLPCQSLTVSGHKFGSVAGIGGLYLKLRPRKICHPMIIGGGQQDNWRSGTIPFSLILTFLTAWDQWHNHGLRQNLRAITAYLDVKLSNLSQYVNMTCQQSVILPHLRLLRCLDTHIDFGPEHRLASVIAYSQGSACQSIHQHGSEALMARGFNKNEQKNFIRLSTHPYLTVPQIDEAIEALKKNH